MLAGADLERPHAFCTRLHALRGPLPRGARGPGGRPAVLGRVRSSLGASIDKDAALLMERWHSAEPGVRRAVFESEVRVRRACALVSAAALEYDDGERVSLAPWGDDALACLVVPLPYRTTGVLTLRCEAEPFDEDSTGPAFRLALRCSKWSHEVAVRSIP